LTCTIYIICHECSGNTYQKRPSDPVKLREYSWNLTLAYQKLLEKHGMVCSMSRKGNCWDNAVAESLFSKAKIESLGGKIFKNIKELEQEVFSYVWWYNNKRYHSSLNYMTPVEYRSVCLNLC